MPQTLPAADAKKEEKQRTVSLTVVSDEESDEQLYKDGFSACITGSLVDAEDIIVASKGMLIDFKIKYIDFTHETWPNKLEDALEDLDDDDDDEEEEEEEDEEEEEEDEEDNDGSTFS